MRLRYPGWQPLTALLGVAGVAHFVVPQPFESIVPDQLGDPSPWVAVSGAAELACAVGLALPATRRVAGFTTAALFVAVFPGNLQMALDSAGSAPWYQTATWLRLPLQVPLVLWALSVARRAQPTGPVRQRVNSTS